MDESVIQSQAEIIISSAGKKPIRVLQVDDEAGLLKVAKQCLELQGPFEVDTASSVQEAMEKLRKREYDAVVSDYQMPGQDGLQFLEALRKNDNAIPFIMFTGKGREEVAVQALNLGAAQYLSKTGDPEAVYGELVHAISKAVERSRAEERLKESEARYRHLCENTKALILTVDLKGKITFVNEIVKDYGFQKAEIIGKNMLSFVPKKYWLRLLKEHAQSARGRPTEGEVEINTPKGKIMAEYRSTPIIENGRVVGDQSTLIDLTARKRMEMALKQSQERFKNAAENMLEWIWEVDAEGKYVYSSPVVKKILGYDPEEVLGKHFYDFFHPEDREQMKKAAFDTFAKKKPFRDFINRNISKHGKTVWLATSGTPLLDDQGKLVGYRGVDTDVTERRRAEDELRGSEAKYRMLVEQMPDVVYAVSGENGKITSLNPAFEKITGWKPSEWIGKSFGEIIHPDDLPLAMEAFQETLRGKTLPPYELRVLSRSGEYLTGEFTSSPQVENGRIIGKFGIVRDITDRKKMELALTNSEERYRKQFEEALDAIFLADAETGILVDCNRAAEQLVGRDRSELVGKHQRILHPPEEVEGQFSKTFKQHLREKHGQTLEAQVITRDGEVRDVAIKANIFELEGKRLIQGTFRDVTENKNVQKMMSENSARFKALFVGNPEAAVHVDAQFRIVDVNPRFQALFGYSLDEVKGKHINEVVAPEDMLEEAEKLDRESANGYVYHDTVRKRKDNVLVPVSISAAPLVINDKLAGYVAVYKDISERKKFEDKLRIVGSLTRHDVRNKLSAITGNIYLHKNKMRDHPEVLEGFNDMQQACEQIVGIFEFASDYEMLGMEEHTLVDVSAAIDKAANALSDLKSVKIVNECRGLVVLADSLLERAFYNLMDNSLKHGEKLTEVRIRHEEAEGGLKLIYEDDGIGIPKDAKAKLFNEGFTTSKGSGYGLYLIKRMMEAYGWTINETGTPGKGAKFTMSIPRAKPGGRQNYKLCCNQAKPEHFCELQQQKGILNSASAGKGKLSAARANNCKLQQQE